MEFYRRGIMHTSKNEKRPEYIKNYAV